MHLLYLCIVKKYLWYFLIFNIYNVAVEKDRNVNTYISIQGTKVPQANYGFTNRKMCVYISSTKWLYYIQRRHNVCVVEPHLVPPLVPGGGRQIERDGDSASGRDDGERRVSFSLTKQLSHCQELI